MFASSLTAVAWAVGSGDEEAARPADNLPALIPSCGKSVDAPRSSSLADGMKLEPDRGDPPENEIPATEKEVSPGHWKYGRISVIIALINLALSCLCLFLWAFSSPVTGGMGYIPFGLMDAIVALALVGVICGQMASKQKRNCLVLLGGLFNASILLVILAIRLA